MANVRISSLPEESSPSASDVVPIDGATTRKTTLEKLVAAGRPLANQGEAEAGTDAEKAMTPLTTKQAITAIGAGLYATTAQGSLADTAVQPDDLGAVATSNSYDDLDDLPTLGTAAAEDVEDFATAAQGTKADTALQPADIGVSVGEKNTFDTIADAEGATIAASVHAITVNGWRAVDTDNGTDVWLTDANERDWYLDEKIVYPEMLGAAGDGETDDTTAIIAFLTRMSSSGGVCHWGDEGREYVCDSNLEGFLDLKHVGKAKIIRGDDTFYVGYPAPNRNIIYAASDGSSSNDGLTPDTPLGFNGAFEAVKRQCRDNTEVIWRLQLLAGTYTGWSECRFEGLPALSNNLEIYGEVDGEGDPTVIFDGHEHSTNLLRSLGSNARLRLDLRDFKLYRLEASQPIYFRYNLEIVTSNLHAEDCLNRPFHYRNGRVNHRGGIIKNCPHGISFENIYGEVGSASASTPDGGGVTFEDISGTAIIVSRGSMAYLRQNTFDNVGIGVEITRLARCRPQSNTFVSWTTAAYKVDQLCLLNDDLANLDTFLGGDEGANALPTIVTMPGAYISRFNGSSGTNRQGHRFFNGPNVTFSGNGVRTRLSTLNSGLVPFQMPAFWLRSPKARGWLTMQIELGADTSAYVELTTAGGDTDNNRIASLTIPERSGGSRVWRVEIDFTGPISGSNFGRFFAKATPRVATGVHTIATGGGTPDQLIESLGNVGPGIEETSFHLYVTPTGDGDCTVSFLETEVSF